MKVDMSPEAVTGRMLMLGQLWELAISLKSSEIVDHPKDENAPQEKTVQDAQDEKHDILG